jgi:ribose 5-phosphate isomerase
LGNGGGYKKGGATKKRYATGGAVNDSGHAVAYPAKKKSAPVSNDRQSGTFKKGGSVTPAEKKEQSFFKSENATAMKQAKAQSNLKYKDGGSVTDASKGAYDKSIGPSEEDMEMAKTIRSIPGKLYEGAKSLFTGKDKPAGSVTKTEKSVTVTPGRKRGGSVKC